MINPSTKVLISCSIMVLLSIQSAHSAEFRAVDVQEWTQKLYSDSAEDRGSAGEHLSEMGEAAKAAVPRLIEIVESDPVMSVRGAASKALGSIGPGAASATPALLTFLKNKQGGIERAYAASALGDIHAQAEACVPVLSELVQNDDQPVVQQLAARALGGFGAQGTPAVPVLIQAIKKGNKDLRDAAIDSLMHIPAAPRDVPALVEMLSDEITAARLAAAKALSGAGSEAVAAVPVLTKLLEDSDDKVRLAAIETLSSLGKEAKSALPALRLLAKDPHMKAPAEEAIATIKSAK